jgi:inner membrane protein
MQLMSNVRAHRVPTVFSHVAVPLALGLAAGAPAVSRRLLLVGLLASVLPDLDVLAFRLGIGYSHEFGHRGFSHSLVFALLVSIAAASVARHLQATRKAAFFFILAATASHGLLDMLTNGGLGVALAWPVSEHRYFFPWHVIEASPLSLRRVFGSAGLVVFKTELLWVWPPSLIAGLAVYAARRKMRPNPSIERTSPGKPGDASHLKR